MYVSAGMPDSAKVLEQYNRIMRAEPERKDINLLHRLVEVLKKAEKNEEVVEVLNRMVGLMPEDKELRLRLAVALHLQDRYLEAEQHFVILLREGNNNG
ncbi:MAG: hypothetical protein ACE5IH_08435 [Thermodesulfobacteriota bacterium]